MTGFRDDFSGGVMTTNYPSITLEETALSAYDPGSGTWWGGEPHARQLVGYDESWFVREANNLQMRRDVSTLSGVPTAPSPYEWDSGAGGFLLRVPDATAAVKGTAICGIYSPYVLDENFAVSTSPRFNIVNQTTAEVMAVWAGSTSFAALHERRESVGAEIKVAPYSRCWALDELSWNSPGGSGFLRDPNLIFTGDWPIYLRIEVDNSVGRGSVRFSAALTEDGAAVASWSDPLGLRGDGAPVLPHVALGGIYDWFHGPGYYARTSSSPGPPESVLALLSWNPSDEPPPPPPPPPPPAPSAKMSAGQASAGVVRMH